MQRNLSELKNTCFDVLIVGGGITGACLAHDAALRGLKTALVEKSDFCGSTSAASSKLIHCGIRYLPKGQVGKVIESARERAIFQNIAPHLANYVPFLIPTIHGDYKKGRGVAHIGMRLFQILTQQYGRLINDVNKKVPAIQFIDRSKTLQIAPELTALANLNGAYALFESHMASSERTVLAYLKSAHHNGSTVANYVEAKSLSVKKGRVAGVEAKDHFGTGTFKIEAKLTINAAGPFIPILNKGLFLNLNEKIRGYSKGVHIVTRQINPQYAMAITTGQKTEGLVDRGGRHFFIIPWRHKSLIGTTDVPFNGDLNQVYPTQKDLLDFLCVINRALPGVKLKKEDINYSYAGLYPLNNRAIKADTYQGTGDYQVVDHAKKEGVEGILTVLGAKYTTARRVAEIGMDTAEMKLRGRKSACQTANTPLRDGRIEDMKVFIERQQSNCRHLLPQEIVKALIQNYGCAIDDVLALATNPEEDLCRLSASRRTLPIQIRYAVTDEMALTLNDVMMRRTGLGTIGHPGKSVVNKVAGLMQPYLGWDDSRMEAEIQSFNAQYHYGFQHRR